MNENVDWNFANSNPLVSGSAFPNHARPSNRTDNFYCLAIRQRKTQERQAHLSDESTVKPLYWILLRSWDYSNLPISFVCVLDGEIATSLSGRSCFGIHPPVASFCLHRSLQKEVGCSKGEGMGWGGRTVGNYQEKIGASYFLSEQVSNTVQPKYILSCSVSYANSTSSEQPATKLDSASPNFIELALERSIIYLIVRGAPTSKKL